MFHRSAYLFFFWALFFQNVSTQAGVPAHNHICVVQLQTDDYALLLNNWLPDPVYITEVVFEVGALDTEQLVYLTGLRAPASIDAQTLITAVAYMQKKMRFSAITFSLKKRSADGYALYVQAESYWALRKVALKGPLIGINTYLQYYTVNHLEPFSFCQHTDSLNRIAQAFKDEGFFQARVYDELIYDQRTKLLDVQLFAAPGICFVIDTIDITYLTSDSRLKQLEEKIQKFVHSRLHKKEAKKKTIEQVSRALEFYLIKKGFEAVQITMHPQFDALHNTVTLVCSIKGGDGSKKISFFGNHYFSKKALFTYLDSLRPASVNLPPVLIQGALEDLYHCNGFWNAKIEIHEEREQYLFVIQEGKRAIIEKVTIHGIDDELQKTAMEKCFMYLATKQWAFDEETFKNSQQQLIDSQITAGFWDFAIDSIAYNQIGDERHEIHIYCIAGERCMVKKITINGCDDLLQQEPFVSFCAQLPCACAPSTVQEQKQTLLKHYNDKGYLYVQVSYELKKTDDGYIHLTWHINQGPHVQFGKTVFVGNTVISFNKLISLLSFKEGESWDMGKISQSLFRLRELGVFETIRIYADAIEKPESTKAVIVQVVDDDPVEMRFRLGFQQVSKNLTFRAGSTYKVGSSIVYKNPFNAGDLFSFNADFTRYYRYISGVYNRPWLGGIPLYGIVKGYSNKYTQPIRIGDDKPLYNAIQQGGLIGCSYRWKKSSIGINVGLEQMEINGLSQEVARAINFEPLLVDKPIPYLFIEPTFFFETLDNKVDPTKGILSVLTSKGMFSWKKGGVNFFKFLFEQSIFFPLYGSVFALHARFGHIFRHSIRAIMPPERFFLGGANSLRGYEPDLAPPLGVIIENGKEKLVPQGGRSLINGTLEFRMYLKYGIGIVLFQDVGALIERSLAEVMGNRLLAATGFGLRYRTPIGPLRFDIGWKWRRHVPQESRYAWFFTLGHAF